MEDRSGVVLAGIEESIVKSSKEIFALLEQGSSKRRTAETLLNKQSSRSHSGGLAGLGATHSTASCPTRTVHGRSLRSAHLHARHTCRAVAQARSPLHVLLILPPAPVFIVTVSVREVTPEGDEYIRVGKLYLVDLAGSENITR